MSRYDLAFFGGIGMGIMMTGVAYEPLWAAVGVLIAVPCALTLDRRQHGR